jgi:hypothetical protein
LVVKKFVYATTRQIDPNLECAIYQDKNIVGTAGFILFGKVFGAPVVVID